MHVVDLVSRLSEISSLQLSPTLIYESVSLAALSAAVLDMFQLGTAPVTAPVTAAAPAGAAPGADASGAAPAAPAAPPAVTAPARLVITGMACRLPGEANTPAGYWANLREGADAVAPPPTDR